MLVVKKGIYIEGASIIWLVIEAGVAIGAGLLAHSLALVAFGSDSIIELIAGVVLLWRLVIEARGATFARVQKAERTAAGVVGAALLLLAVYIVIAAIHKLWTHQGAEASPLGIGLAIVSTVLMLYFSRAKLQIGDAIGSKALKADGACSIVCAYMAITVLIGAALTALLGWWWIDAVISFGLTYFVVKEGIEAIQAARGVVDT
ncbi:MAG: cation transporter [Peptococcaceae bacterium]|nr:cation transporter [Peptococcaceae bacterium]